LAGFHNLLDSSSIEIYISYRLPIAVHFEAKTLIAICNIKIEIFPSILLVDANSELICLKHTSISYSVVQGEALVGLVALGYICVSFAINGISYCIVSIFVLEQLF